MYFQAKMNFIKNKLKDLRYLRLTIWNRITVSLNLILKSLILVLSEEKLLEI